MDGEHRLARAGQGVRARRAAGRPEPEDLLLSAGAGAGLAQLGLSTTDAVVSLIVFIIVGSLTIAGPVVYFLVGGDGAKVELDSIKAGSPCTTPP